MILKLNSQGYVKGQGLCKLIIGIEVVNISSPHTYDSTIQICPYQGLNGIRTLSFI
jgi:hypothetical protein